jgi:hypothetical protein
MLAGSSSVGTVQEVHQAGGRFSGGTWLKIYRFAPRQRFPFSMLKVPFWVRRPVLSTSPAEPSAVKWMPSIASSAK